jgi:8-oxo-dGTP diphosphatase
VLLSPREGHLAVLLKRSRGEGGEREGEGDRDGAGWTLPWGTPWPTDATLDACARRIAALALRDTDACAPTWLAQVGAFADARHHPGQIDLSIGIVATVPASNRHDAARRGDARHDDGNGGWFTEIPALPDRHRAVLDAAVATVRLYIDTAPVAFRLLPATFTLSELQQVYEILLGYRLHKASFRRALLAASLVEATDEWRSEGRGRPAQLFRYAPRRRRPPRRGVRFDLVHG